MGRRTYGRIRCLLLLALDGGIVYYFSREWGIAGIVVLCIAGYAFWLGEICSVVRLGAIRMDKLDALTKSKLQAGAKPLLECYNGYILKEKCPVEIYLIPDDCAFHTYTFGYKKIGLTSEVLNTLDPYAIGAALSHELGHVLALDVCVKRILLANGVVFLGILCIAEAMWFVLGIFLCIIIAWLFGSCMGMWAGIGVFKGVKKLGKGALELVLLVGRIIMGVLDRSDEYRADAFAVELGYGRQLLYVLERYIGDTQPVTHLGDILYATHPKTRKRIIRLEKRMQQGSVNIVRTGRHYIS